MSNKTNINNFNKILLCFVFLFLPIVTLADIETARKYYENQDYEKALIELKPLLSGNLPEAQNLWG